MKAAVFYGPNDTRVEEIDKPKLTPNGVIMKVRSCGICGSDLHFYKLGGKRMHPGEVMGHEFSGDVVEVGESVRDIRAGDRVAAICFQPCFNCAACKAGLFEMCANQLSGGIDIPGAYAEYVSVPLAVLNRTIFKLADSTTYDEGALIEPFGVGYLGAARANPAKTDIIAIFGAGIIGLSCLVAFKARGVSRIIISEMSQTRLKLAGELGADVLINAAEEDVAGRIIAETGGAGLDIAVECTGIRKPFFTALKTLRVDGLLLQVGVFTQAFEFNPVTLTDKCLKINGYTGGDYAASAAAINAHTIDFKKLVSHTFPLDKINEAFTMQFRADESVKVMVKP
jgi:threonine dehydrogenase-like Zn-dependent dehydrogenase